MSIDFLNFILIKIYFFCKKRGTLQMKGAKISFFSYLSLKKAVSAVIHISLFFLGKAVNIHALPHSSPRSVGNGRIKGGKLDAGGVYTRYRAGSVLAIVSHIMLFCLVGGFLFVILFHFRTPFLWGIDILRGFCRVYYSGLIFLFLCDKMCIENFKRSTLMLYNNLSGYFREKYGKRLQKICIDGGFSCPNRDGRCGEGGCIYCGERGAGEHIDATASITEQVRRGLCDGEADDMFAAYFQSFTNTYAPVYILKERYDAALIDERIKVLAIGTRPDCIDEDAARLIASYKDRVDVWVELGLQTASDRTADIINRGYHKDAFEGAMALLKKYDIPVVVHLIVGLPGEDINDVKSTVEYINGFDIFGIKIHSIYVMRGTRLADMYERGEYIPPSLEEYVDSAVYILTHISPRLTVHRLTGDCPKDMLIAPAWNSSKNEIINTIVYKMQLSDLKQGCEYK